MHTNNGLPVPCCTCYVMSSRWLLSARLPLSGATLSSAVSVRSRRYSYAHVPKKRTPHLLGPGREWRKCFVVRPHTQLLRPLEKYQWLTGSMVEEGLPAMLSPLTAAGEEDMAEFEARVWEALRSAPARWERAESVRGLLAGTLPSVWMNGAEHLREASLTPDPRVECFWRCRGENYLCVSHPLYILHCRQPLQLFTDPTSPLSPSHTPSPAELSPAHLGLFKHSFDQIRPFSGCHRFSPTPFTHTVILMDLQARDREQLLAHGLMQLFTQAAAECVQNGYPLGQPLAYPLASQGLVTNSHSLTFLCFQLNSLDLSSSSTACNVLWVGPTLQYLSEDGKSVNRELSELLFRFLLHRPTRQQPSLSGFGMRREEERQKREDNVRKKEAAA